ncbi:Peroxisome biogenesis factor 10 [Collichthys lucidus]|uniref:RING-type E3 ubiquitin transferase n=1 Tax=Collichthys lucidus TaxID=240159 RepID=A0A4U5UR76_COLLU|nr:Peroxisome biogenesis factor 10 [Collichthys lucidus]
MPLAPANQSQLVRSSQKDEYYRTSLRNNANEAFQTLAGSKRWLDWRREIELLSDLAYYGLTTFSGYQTLGEEYVNIVQVDPTKRQIPSWARRGLFVLCHAYFPYLLGKVLVCLENELEGGQESRSGVGRRQAASGLWSLESWLRRWMVRAVGLLSVPQRKACLPAVFVLQQSLTLLHRLHVALFYISGSFYHLSKRAAGISYVAQQLQTETESQAGVEALQKPQSPAYTELKIQSFPLHPLPGGEATLHIHSLWTPVLLGVHHRVVQHQGRVPAVSGEVPAS